ncbi:hypothetical protein ACFV8Z_44215 [Streptomyces sp. NPDC059837]|uniref:hypothetical protein n=1 Tax=Streptomyces sp. NPDC059837 TaxID=3346968 RepID=UPI0036648147
MSEILGRYLFNIKASGREVEFQAGRGEWFCALEWARLLGRSPSAFGPGSQDQQRPRQRTLALTTDTARTSEPSHVRAN